MKRLLPGLLLAAFALVACKKESASDSKKEAAADKAPPREEPMGTSPAPPDAGSTGGVGSTPPVTTLPVTPRVSDPANPKKFDKPRRGPARLAFGAVTVTGGLDKDEVRRRMRSKETTLRYCQESLAATVGYRPGELMAEFTVDNSGRVVACAVVADDSDLATCVKGVIQTISFPRPKEGNAVVSYQLAFVEGP